MSDRVAIIGGSTVGRDHFPFPVPTFESGAFDKSWPMNVELEEICRWFYRIKKWQFYMQFSYSTSRGPRDPGHEGEYVGGTGNIQFDFIPKIRTGPSNYEVASWAREAQSVLLRSGAPCILSLGFDGTAEAGLDITGEEVPFTVSNVSGSSTYDDGSGEPVIFGTLRFDCTNLFYESGTFKPWFALRLNTIEDDGMYMATDNSAIGDVPFAFVVVGETQTVDLLQEGDLGGVATQVTTADITCAPIEYWPYATKAGLSVYDTSTGAQLRDPLS